MIGSIRGENMPGKESKQTQAVLEDIDRFTKGKKSQEIFADHTSGYAATAGLIDTRPFKGSRTSSRIANKLFQPALVALKKSVHEAVNQLDRKHNETIQRLDGVEHAIQEGSQARLLFDEKIYEVEKLIDRLKSEIMAEINKDQSPTGETGKIETEIINKERYKALKKLNLGSGSFFKEGYLNVDHRKIEGVDLVADIGDLPYENGTLDEIFLSHVVEHFTEKKMLALLKYWHTLLVKGGAIVIIVPDIESMIHQFEKKEISWENLRAVVLGGQDYNSDYHFNMFSVGYIQEMVKKALPGASIEVISNARKNGECLELEVKVTK